MSIVMGNYATHKTPKIKAWLARRPHYHVHFTPTSASWINQVERWFAELTRKQIQRGVHTSNGPSPQTRFWLPSNASATMPSRLYVATFRFT